MDTRLRHHGVWLLLLVGVWTSLPALVWAKGEDVIWRRVQSIRILGTTVNQRNELIGTVGEVAVGLEQRQDRQGIMVTFRSTPGQFSAYAQGAMLAAIDRVARQAHLNTDSWSVSFAVIDPGVVIYGDSLSAMAGIAVAALAKGDEISRDAVMTGTVTEDGHIGSVGQVPLKVKAAGEKRLRRVLVPDETDVSDADWQTPFLMQVSPVRSVSDAYEALTGRSLDEPAPLR
jgi:predicted S18 family serine protease